MEYLKYIELVAAVWMVYAIVMITTHTPFMTFMFKFVPMVLVLGLIFDAGIRLGFVLAPQ